MQRVTVKLDNWLRGEKDSMLYRDRDGKMCCLGFVAIASGLTRGNITDCACPYEVETDDLRGLWGKLLDSPGDDSVFAHKAMQINDSLDLTDEARQEKLIALFAENGIELVFE